MTTKANLLAARINKNDEFYTSYNDIEKELIKYKQHFKDKIIYCNCDDPTWSQFYTYLKNAFEHYKYSKLVTTHYVAGGVSFMREFNGSQEIDTQLTGDGDFRSEECKAILDQVDIVITNPPFSLFREFVALLQEKQKQFLIIGNNNAITYKDCFKLIKDNKMWLGVNNNKTMEFRLHNSYLKWSRMDTQGNKYGNVPSISWFTNLTHNKRNQPIDLYKNYSPTEYPKYDNYDAIEVSKTINIPQDYTRMMGVPITFLDKYCPTQFEIIGSFNGGIQGEELGAIKSEIIQKEGLKLWNGPIVNKKALYFRVIIKHKNPVTTQVSNQASE